MEQLLILEAVDINRGRVGIEIELLVRRDIYYSKAFDGLLFDTGFMKSTDSSIERTPWTNDVYYLNFETNNIEPMFWKDLKPKLTELASWLKREDFVPVSRNLQKTQPKGLFKRKVPTGVDHSGIIRAPFPEPGAEWKKIKLPRGKMPTNASTGLHIHFDANEWFDSAEHAATFVKLFNRHGEDMFKSAVIPSRYMRQFDRGNTFARFDPLNEPNPKSLGSDTAIHYFHAANRGKNMALNCKAALNRGDVEFRFVHGTLNIGTIEGWMMSFAELIEFSRHYQFKKGGWFNRDKSSRQDFENYLSTENPEVSQFLAQRKAKMKSAQLEPNPKTTYSGPNKTSRDLIRRLRRFNALKDQDSLDKFLELTNSSPPRLNRESERPNSL